MINISSYRNIPLTLIKTGGELFMQLEKEGIFMEDTAWYENFFSDSLFGN